MKKQIMMVCTVGMLTFLATPRASAQVVTQWWGNLTSTTWDTTTLAWTSNYTATANATVPWTNGNFAAFGGANTYTATVNGVSAAGLFFNGNARGQGTYIFLPGSGPLTNGNRGIALGGTGAYAAYAYFCNDIVLSANQTWQDVAPAGYSPRTSSAVQLVVTGKVSGAASLTKAGGCAMVVSNVNNSFSGGLILNNGTISAYAPASSTVLGNGPLTIGTIVPTDGSTSYGLTTLNLYGGTANNTTTIGDLTNSGPAVLALYSNTGATNTLSGVTLVRVAPGTLSLTPQTGLGVREQVNFTGGTNLTAAGILQPWIVNTANNGDFLANGASGLTNVVYAGGFNAGLNNKVVTNTVATSLTSDGQTYYAAKLTANLNLNGHTLTLGDGGQAGLILKSASITNGGSAANLDFGGAEALVFVGSGNSGAIATPLTGSGSLTKFGSGTLVISNADLWPNTVNLNDGTLSVWPTGNKSVSANWIVGGMGGLTKDGPNILNLSGTNSFGGLLKVNGGGALQVGPNAVLASGGASVGDSSPNSTMTINSTTWNLLNGSITMGNLSGATNNVLTVSGGIMTNVVLISIGHVAGATGNSATFTNGVQIIGEGSGCSIYVGKYAAASTLTIGGSGAACLASNFLQGITVGGGGTAGANNSTLNVTNATLVAGGGTIGSNNTNPSSSNTVNILATGTYIGLGGLSIGVFAGDVSNSVVINGGTTIVGGGGGGLALGLPNAPNNGATIKNGGTFSTKADGPVNFGSAAATGGTNDYYNVGGDGARSTAINGPINMWGYNNVMTVTNATLTSGATLIGSGGMNNTASICNGGTWTLSGDLTVGGGTSAGNVVQVFAGGVLDITAKALITSSGAGNVITNTGGVYQFNAATPTITPGAGFGSIAINGGSASFRGITTADVRCNQDKYGLASTTNMLWAGKNAFRLNNATNTTTGQAYTFMDNGTATNFVRLELLNGSMYRTNVTLGAGGSLYVSGINYVSGVLTAADTTAIIEIDLSNTNVPSYLVAQTNVYLNGCHLQLDLGNPPVLNTPITVISNVSAGVTSGSFAGGSSQSVTVGGTNYLVRIQTNGGASGKDVVVTMRKSISGTGIFFGKAHHCSCWGCARAARRHTGTVQGEKYGCETATAGLQDSHAVQRSPVVSLCAVFRDLPRGGDCRSPAPVVDDIPSALHAFQQDSDLRRLYSTVMSDHVHLLFELRERLTVSQLLGKFRIRRCAADGECGLHLRRPPDGRRQAVPLPCSENERA